MKRFKDGLIKSLIIIVLLFFCGWLWDGIIWDFWLPVEWIVIGIKALGIWFIFAVVYFVTAIRINMHKTQDKVK